MALGDLATVKLHYTNTLNPVAENGFGMQCISPFVNWRDLLAAEFIATILPDWRLGVIENISVLEVVVTDVVPGTGLDVVVPLPGVSGAIPGEQAPWNCAYCLSWRGEGTGRNTRGRSFLAGMPRSQIFNGTQWDTDTQDWVVDFATVMLAQYGPTGFSDLARLNIISRGPRSAPLAVPQAFPVTRVVLDSRVASMRKRRLR